MPYFKKLCDAIRHNDYKACQAILAESRLNPARRFNINGINEHGYAPIHLAVGGATIPIL